MKVSIFGVWHLGSVTAACAADAGHMVVGVDDNPEVIERLNEGIAPLFEPGLEELIRRGIKRNNLRFCILEKPAFKDSDVVWVTYDTPVNDDDQADVELVIRKVIEIFPFLSNDTVVLVSSQLPVGSIRRLETYANENYPSLQLSFACMPENLRLGQAITVFTDPDRVIVGVRSDTTKAKLLEFLQPITDKIEWMSIESAEMTKHAINSFLATSITFTNELASICEQVGASAKEVERGLKTEARIGPKAYVSPGGAFAGGTLARDIEFLSEIASTNNIKTPIISSVRISNNEHKNWARNKLIKHFGTLSDVTVAIWGLTYKAGTSTLRRSTAVELCDWILSQGASINVFDPMVAELPKNWGRGVSRFSSGRKALENAQALVVATEWPELQDIAVKVTAAELNNMLVVDANGFVKDILAGKAMKYCVVGEHICRGEE